MVVVSLHWGVEGERTITAEQRAVAQEITATQDGAVVVVDITIGADGRAIVGRPVVHPTWVDRSGGWVVHLVQRSLADAALPAARRPQLELSLGRTGDVLGGFFTR